MKPVLTAVQLQHHRCAAWKCAVISAACVTASSLWHCPLTSLLIETEISLLVD